MYDDNKTQSRLTMVARAGGYYGTVFGGERGVTQGNPLSPTIFNVVVYAVVRHWVNGIVEEAEARKETGRCLVGPRLAPGRFYRPGRHI